MVAHDLGKSLLVRHAKGLKVSSRSQECRTRRRRLQGQLVDSPLRPHGLGNGHDGNRAAQRKKKGHTLLPRLHLPESVLGRLASRLPSPCLATSVKLIDVGWPLVAAAREYVN